MTDSEIRDRKTELVRQIFDININPYSSQEEKDTTTREVVKELLHFQLLLNCKYDSELSISERMEKSIKELMENNESVEMNGHEYYINWEKVLSMVFEDEECECQEGERLFSEKEFQHLYPSLDEDCENDKKIKQIKDKLSGIALYKEYSEEYVNRVNELFEKYPNFTEYKHFFIPDSNILKIKFDKRIIMDNILIYGDPACGKSSFVNQLCEIYGDYYRTSLGNGSVNFTLMGNDKGYNKSECGDILRSMFKKEDRPVPNPLVILDELDKAAYGSGKEIDFSGTFSILLEKNNAKKFSDNFFKVEVDASHINYIAIANDISKIPAHILSRFPIKLHIRNYTEEELKEVVFDNQYKSWIKNNCINPKQLPGKLTPVAKNLVFECSEGHPRNVEAVFSKIASETVINNENGYYATFQPSFDQYNLILSMFRKEETKSSRIGFSL